MVELNTNAIDALRDGMADRVMLPQVFYGEFWYAKNGFLYNSNGKNELDTEILEMLNSETETVWKFESVEDFKEAYDTYFSDDNEQFDESVMEVQL